MMAIGLHVPVNNAPTQTNESPQDQTTPPSRSVRISETVTLVETNSKNTSGTSQERQSILLSASTPGKPPTTEPETEGADPTSKGKPSEIYNRNQMLYCVFSDDGMKESAYHVANFAGFYPVWPIIKFSMAPSGATKDERTTSFIKCVTALLGEILYVDDAAMITPIDITDDDEGSLSRPRRTSQQTLPS
jgi:hypothetical protein